VAVARHSAGQAQLGISAFPELFFGDEMSAHACLLLRRGAGKKGKGREEGRCGSNSGVTVRRARSEQLSCRSGSLRGLVVDRTRCQMSALLEIPEMIAQGAHGHRGMGGRGT